VKIESRCGRATQTSRISYGIKIGEVRMRLRNFRKNGARPALGKAVASGSMQHGVPMRDLVADWKKWSRAERVLAVMGTLLMVALPFGLLMTG
jgi:hypothetical protein